MHANIVWGTQPDLMIHKGHRLQIAVGHILIAEAVFETYEEAVRVRDEWQCLRYERGLGMGGAVINRVDLKRLWDVPVGSVIE